MNLNKLGSKDKNQQSSEVKNYNFVIKLWILYRHTDLYALTFIKPLNISQIDYKAL
jgi:hypothetical protein